MRRAAGTTSLVDLLRIWVFRRPQREPATDIRDLQAGVTLLVSAFARRDGRFRQGYLVLDLDASRPAVWRPYRPLRSSGQGIPLPAPYDVESVGAIPGPDGSRVNRFQFRLLTVYTNGELWELAVPTSDIELVRFAIGALNARQPSI